MPTGRRDEYLRKTSAKQQADDEELRGRYRSIKADEWPEQSHFMVPATQQLRALGKAHNEKYSPEKAYRFIGKGKQK